MRRPMSAVDRVALGLGRAMLALLGAVLVQQSVLRVVRRLIHLPAPPFISVFLDSPFRRALQPPEEGSGNDCCILGPFR